MKIPKKNNKITSAVEVIIKAVAMCLTSKKVPVTLAGHHLAHNDGYMVLDTGIDAPSGYIRYMSKSIRENRMYISFYSTSALNKTENAEYLFPVKLPADCNEIYMYQGEENYKLTFLKDAKTGKWCKA